MTVTSHWNPGGLPYGRDGSSPPYYFGWEMNCRFCSLLDFLEQKGNIVTQQVQLRVVQKEPTTLCNLVPRVLSSYPRKNLGTSLTVVNFFGRINITTAFIWLYVLVSGLKSQIFFSNFYFNMVKNSSGFLLRVKYNYITIFNNNKYISKTVS